MGGDKGVEKDTVTYNSMIDCEAKKGNVDAARDLFKEMGDKGVERNTVTYASMISCEAKKGKSIKTVIALFKELRQKRNSIDSYTMTALFTASRNFNDKKFGKEMVDFLFHQKVQVTEKSWS